MSESPTPAVIVTTEPKPPAADVNGQLIVSVVIVLVLGLLGGGLLLVGYELKDLDKATVGVATIIGALANSLTAPTGVANVLRAGKTNSSGQ